MKKLFPLMIMFIPLIRVNGGDSLHVEWVFENSFEKEYVYINEAVTVIPEECREAMEFYRRGAYRRAADILEQVRKLELPDGSLDFTAFVLAECYRKLNLREKAVDEYTFIAKSFSGTDKRPPALYRLLEYAAKNNNIEKCDSIRDIFNNDFSSHPLNSSVLYNCARLYYDQKFPNESLKLIGGIHRSSIRYYQGIFLASLCHIQLKEWEKAHAILKKIMKHAPDIDIKNEAVIVTGDIHYKRNKVGKAMEFYRKVPRKATRYEYAQVKVARCLFDDGKFESVVRLAKKFLERRSTSDYFFEMASMLEQAYHSMGKEEQAREVASRIHRQIVGMRITFEIYDEIDRITDLTKRWQLREYEAIARNDQKMRKWADNGRKRSEDLKRRLRLLLGNVDRKYDEKKISMVPHIAERRYIALIKKEMERIEDTLSLLRREREAVDTLLAGGGGDTLAMVIKDSLSTLIRQKESAFREKEHEHELIISECLGGEVEGQRLNEEMQAKFIDWEFMKYLDKKKAIVEATASLAEARRKKKKTDTLERRDSAEVKEDSTLTAGDIELMHQTIADERERLINHIETMLDIYPQSRYAPATLFRLAELFFDAAGDRFRKKMADYERELMTASDTTSIPFPEYELQDAIDVYQRIYTQFPKDLLADDAYFYRALALRKQGLEDSAHAEMVALIERYPQSEYYIEANMNIGKYHFEYPRKSGGKGYQLAEAAFRNVLFYRNHPQFVQALYHLGWCYYMQDRYEEAIAAFKYMIEEVELDFDPRKKDDVEIRNPLLRSEAIDYLAISFDQEKDLNKALQFFKLIGNNDYAAMVLKRMGELCEEDLNFDGAIERYKKLIETYPSSFSAPEASALLIKLYENAGDRIGAARERDFFFNEYSAGGKWQKRFDKSDSITVNKVDSMAIAIGLSVADNLYRHAEAENDRAAFQHASRQYGRVVKKYPDHPRAEDAAWNLAAILDLLGDKPGAYNRFMTFSKLTDVNKKRRETAALNAIAIAQSLMPPDSVIRKGSLGFAGKKLVEAVHNYLTLFPEGKSVEDVLFTMGGIYFNRHMYDSAAAVYERITAEQTSPERHYEALLLLGQCRFGNEQWDGAAELFSEIMEKSPDTSQRSTAKTFLLQSRYFKARGMMSAKKYAEAAVAFKKLEEEFPGSKYGDIAQFSAAEAYEKEKEWLKACDRYYELVEKYPDSRFAPDALFNAAGNFERAERFARAADAYELLVKKYPESGKAKDGLFNLGFCYEKLGRIDAMILANERYSMKYPDEKDVEALLLRSASYYAKTGMLDKAIDLFRNFIRRFPYSEKSVESYYMIGKCYFDRGDYPNARLSFNQAEQHNMQLSQSGKGNNYYASEAALFYGNIVRGQFEAIKLRLPEENLEASLKEKSELLKDAAGSYQRVLQYRGEKMFEAAFRMGQLYESLADAIARQEKPEQDPIKAALNENAVMNSASRVLQNSFLPYKKGIELASAFDSLSKKQNEWIDRCREHLSENIILAGTYMYEGVGAMQKAPIPAVIREQPLALYQYKIKLLETLEPMKMKVLGYFSEMLDSLERLTLDDSLTIQCEIHVARLNYLIGSAYDRLAVEILKATENLPRTLSEDEKEELLFQLEDIVFELQDRAMVQLAAAKRRILEKKLQKSTWYQKIVASLARLNPEKYGTSFYRQVRIRSDAAWIARGDSVQGWKSAKPPLEGWSAASVIPMRKNSRRKLPAGAVLLGRDSLWSRMYLWKNAFCPGIPRDAQFDISVPGKYRLYVNGILTLSDTAGISEQIMYDNATGIVSLFKGGDNIIACEINDSLSVRRGIALALRLLVDTTESYSSSVKGPVVSAAEVKPSLREDTITVGSAVARNATVEKASEEPADVKKKNELTRKEVLTSIEDYRERERKALAELRKERLAIQRLRILIEEKEEKKLLNPEKPAPVVPAPLPK